MNSFLENLESGYTELDEGQFAQACRLTLPTTLLKTGRQDAAGFVKQDSDNHSMDSGSDPRLSNSMVHDISVETVFSSTATNCLGEEVAPISDKRMIHSPSNLMSDNTDIPTVKPDPPNSNLPDLVGNRKSARRDAETCSPRGYDWTETSPLRETTTSEGSDVVINDFTVFSGDAWVLIVRCPLTKALLLVGINRGWTDSCEEFDSTEVLFRNRTESEDNGGDILN